MHIQADRAFVPAGTAATRYLSVTLSAPAAPSGHGPDPARSGVDVSLVLDRSGSMGGRKIALARQAVAHAIRLLDAGDRLNVVAYDHDVETVLELMPATAAARKQALQALELIDARGSTDLAEGWFTGARALGASAPPGLEPRDADLPFPGGPGAASTRTSPGRGVTDRVRRVLLLTDGLANRGITQPSTLRAAAAHFRAEGIGTTAFGLGSDFDEELLASLAAEGGGHFYFIEHPQQIADFFASELGEVLEVTARDVLFEVAAGPGARVAVLNPMPVEQDGRVTRVRLGDFVSEQEVTLLVAVHIDAQAEGASAAIQCRVRDREGAMAAQPMAVEWTAVSVERDRQQPVNGELILAVARMLAERGRMLALVENRRGRYEISGQLLREAAEQVEQLGAQDEAVRAVLEALLGEASVFARRMDVREMKARHMASHAVAYSRDAEGKAKRRG